MNVHYLSKKMKYIVNRERTKSDSALRERLFEMFSPRKKIYTVSSGPKGERLLILLVLAEEGFAEWTETKTLANGDLQLFFRITQSGLKRREKFYEEVKHPHPA